MVNSPALYTSVGSVGVLEQPVLCAIPAVEHWFRSQWLKHKAPFYASVDLRNSSFKLAPVDTNLFPGGFNNLAPDFLPLCVQAVVSAVDKLCPVAKNMLLIPESHTRNKSYLQNVATLRYILRQAGLNVRVASLLPEIVRPTAIELPGNGNLLLEPLRRGGNRLGVEGFDACVVLLNNDLSAGVPEMLQGLEQIVLPPLRAGWVTRRKSKYFFAYDQIAQEFADLIGIDPWLINPYFERCGKINFHERRGEECLAGYISEILDSIRIKYKEYGIDREPFVIVKADAGTYGMGIMTIKHVDEIRDLNRKQRNKMSTVKEGVAVTDVLVQEGVYTSENIDGAVAEPVVYLMGTAVVGGFYRVHTSRGQNENLNAPGMHFSPQAFTVPCSLPELEGKADCVASRLYIYGVVARLAALAASAELERMEVAEEPARDVSEI